MFIAIGPTVSSLMGVVHFKFHLIRRHFWCHVNPIRQLKAAATDCVLPSVTSKRLPNVYKSCPKMISLEKLRILTSLQKLPKNGRLWKVALSPINRPIWSHCPRLQILLEHWSRESKYAAGSLTQSKTLNCKSHFFLRDSNQSPWI